MSESQREQKEDSGPSWMRAVDQKVAAAAESAVPDETCTVAGADHCAKDKEKIKAHIAKMSEYAGHHLDTLKADLEKSDKPTWTERLLESVLEISLATGGALVGEYVAEHYLADEAKALKEFLKKSVEEAAPGGRKAAVAALAGAEQPDPGKFIESQKDGVTALYEDVADRFVESGQDRVLTKRQAKELAKAFDAAHGVHAAYGHYRASRDAYLSCLAKQTLGARADGNTDMSSQQEHQQHGADGHAPDLIRAKLGFDRGVLSVQVSLADDALREPHVFGAILNGVNETIRSQYEHVPLSALNIPRQLQCVVRGGTDFTLNVDESGTTSLVRGSGEWLEARARGSGMDVIGVSSRDQQRIGAELLLKDVEIDEIQKGGI